MKLCGDLKEKTQAYPKVTSPSLEHHGEIDQEGGMDQWDGEINRLDSFTAMLHHTSPKTMKILTNIDKKDRKDD